MVSFRDLRYGVRLFRKSPGFSAAALAALALGLGAATAIFSVVDAVLLKALPFRDPDRLAVIWEKNPTLSRFQMFVAPANFMGWQQRCSSLRGTAAVQDTAMNLTAGPNGHVEPEELKVEKVSASLFSLLGVQPWLGRAFRPEEDRPGGAEVALLSYSLWTQRFGGDRAISGKSIHLGAHTLTVVGVMPKGFSVLQRNIDVWLPIALDSADTRAASGRTLVIVARLQDGVSLERASKELAVLGDRMEQENRTLNAGWRPDVYSLRDQIEGKVEKPLFVLSAAVAFLLLIACGNVANLLLARGATRRREVAIRAALGAGRLRIACQLLSESLVLALAGGALGLVLAAGGVRLLVRFGPDSIPHLAAATLDLRLFGFALAISVLTGMLFGALPSFLVSGASLTEALNDSTRGGTTSRAGRRLRNGLVVLEVALAVLVLIGAGLLARGFGRLRSLEPGFQPDGLLTMRLPLAGGRNASPERRIAFFHEISERLAALPGVRGAGAVNTMPLNGFGVGTTFAVDGRPAPPREQRPIALLRTATPAYFTTIGIPLLAGRTFADWDTVESPQVCIVSRTLARRSFPGDSSAALGGRIVVDATNGRVCEIVGVVGDVKPDTLDGEEWPMIYSPYPQGTAATMEMVLRTGGPPSSLVSAVTRTVHDLDPDQPVASVRPMMDVVDHSLAAARFNALVLGIFAAIAFVLAAVGIYGVISYDVSQRTHEIGIRVALGAASKDVMRLVVGEGARLAAYGIAVGVAAALALTGRMADMLYGVKPNDLYTFAGMSMLLGAVALAASYLPSRRAMALEPLEALRHE